MATVAGMGLTHATGAPKGPASASRRSLIPPAFNCGIVAVFCVKHVARLTPAARVELGVEVLWKCLVAYTALVLLLVFVQPYVPRRVRRFLDATGGLHNLMPLFPILWIYRCVYGGPAEEFLWGCLVTNRLHYPLTYWVDMSGVGPMFVHLVATPFTPCKTFFVGHLLSAGATTGLTDAFRAAAFHSDAVACRRLMQLSFALLVWVVPLVVSWILGPRGDSSKELEGSRALPLTDDPVASGSLRENQKFNLPPLYKSPTPRGKRRTSSIKLHDWHLSDIPAERLADLTAALRSRLPRGALLSIGEGCVLVTLDVDAGPGSLDRLADSEEAEVADEEAEEEEGGGGAGSGAPEGAQARGNRALRRLVESVLSAISETPHGSDSDTVGAVSVFLDGSGLHAVRHRADGRLALEEVGEEEGGHPGATGPGPLQLQVSLVVPRVVGAGGCTMAVRCVGAVQGDRVCVFGPPVTPGGALEVIAESAVPPPPHLGGSVASVEVNVSVPPRSTAGPMWVRAMRGGGRAGVSPLVPLLGAPVGGGAACEELSRLDTAARGAHGDEVADEVLVDLALALAGDRIADGRAGGQEEKQGDEAGSVRGDVTVSMVEYLSECGAAAAAGAVAAAAAAAGLSGRLDEAGVLHAAVLARDVKLVRALAAREAGLDLRASLPGGAGGETCLHLAAGDPNISLLQALFDARGSEAVDVAMRARDAEGLSPMDRASKLHLETHTTLIHETAMGQKQRLAGEGGGPARPSSPAGGSQVTVAAAADGLCPGEVEAAEGASPRSPTEEAACSSSRLLTFGSGAAEQSYLTSLATRFRWSDAASCAFIAFVWASILLTLAQGKARGRELFVGGFVISSMLLTVALYASAAAGGRLWPAAYQRRRQRVLTCIYLSRLLTTACVYYSMRGFNIYAVKGTGREEIISRIRVTACVRNVIEFVEALGARRSFRSTVALQPLGCALLTAIVVSSSLICLEPSYHSEMLAFSVTGGFLASTLPSSAVYVLERRERRALVKLAARKDD